MIAQRDYREAYDAGDSDKLVAAQTKMNEAQYKLGQAQGMKPQYTLQNSENGVDLDSWKKELDNSVLKTDLPVFIKKMIGNKTRILYFWRN